MRHQGIPITYHPGERYILFVGGGRAAAGKLAALSRFQPPLRLVAPDILPETRRLTRNFPRLQLRQRRFRPRDLASVCLAYIFTDTPRRNTRIARLCRKRGIPVNCAAPPGTPPELRHRYRDFSSPATACFNDTIVAVASGGRDTPTAIQIRNRIYSFLMEQHT